MINFTVHVEDGDGCNVKGAKVFLDIHGLIGSWSEDYTDSDGDVSFEIEKRSEITFHVSGDEYQTETVEDSDCIYITI